MIMAQIQGKVTESHLKRNAYIYIRQSTMKQVLQNTESTQRQYALRRRAVALGWPMERVITIDKDQASSGAQAADREGFQDLVKEVGIGRAGIVMGLEVARLSRSFSQWHRLMEICALTDTLVLDQDGIYDTNNFNDRLLLGLKATMSQAELHLLRARLQGGVLNKAAKGELRSRLPVGFVYSQQGRVVLDPDKQVQESIRRLFDTFRRTKAACSTAKVFRERGWKFPRRLHTGPHKGELVWAELVASRVRNILHNPRYAGAFFYGRTRTRTFPDGKVLFEKLPRKQWHSLIREAHEGYISWQRHEENLRRLRENARALGRDCAGSPREGPALLQGIVLCGVCGNQMTVSYHERGGELVGDYACRKESTECGKRICRQIPWAAIDQAVGQLLLEKVNTGTLGTALSVQKELQSRFEEADRLRKKQVERARYDAQIAQRRYMQVDPGNRFVADSLEAEWNQKLLALDEAERDYEHKHNADRVVLEEKQRAEVLALDKDFPRLWRDPKTSPQERKRMVRLLVEDVTLVRSQEITMHVRFKGGPTKTLNMPIPAPPRNPRHTSPEVVTQIDRLLDHYREGRIASILNQRGLRSTEGLAFHTVCVAGIRRNYGLRSRFERLREAGMLTLKEVAKILGVPEYRVKTLRKEGLLKAKILNDRKGFLYEHPGSDLQVKVKRRNLPCGK